MRGMEKQTILDIRELFLISVTCCKCDAELTVDASRDNARVPERCPCCTEDFRTQGIQDVIVDYRRMFTKLMSVMKNSGHRITLRVKPQPLQSGEEK